MTIETPRCGVPAGATDAHSHVLGPYDTYPLAHGRDYTPPEALVDQYQQVLTTVGFDHAVVVQPSIYGTDNRATLAAVSAIGLDRSRAVVMLPTDTNTAELDRLHQRGARGVRFLSLQTGSPSLEGIEPFARRLADFGWHLQCWLRPEEWTCRLTELAALPVPVVFDHLAQLSPTADSYEADISSLQRSMDTGSVWVKVIGYRLSNDYPRYRDMAATIQRLVRSHPQRLVWGLDWPHTNLLEDVPDDGALVDAFAGALPDSDTLRRILVDNPSSLYQFG